MYSCCLKFCFLRLAKGLFRVDSACWKTLNLWTLVNPRDEPLDIRHKQNYMFRKHASQLCSSVGSIIFNLQYIPYERPAKP